MSLECECSLYLVCCVVLQFGVDWEVVACDLRMFPVLSLLCCACSLGLTGKWWPVGRHGINRS